MTSIRGARLYRGTVLFLPPVHPGTFEVFRMGDCPRIQNLELMAEARFSGEGNVTVIAARAPEGAPNPGTPPEWVRPDD